MSGSYNFGSGDIGFSRHYNPQDSSLTRQQWVYQQELTDIMGEDLDPECEPEVRYVPWDTSEGGMGDVVPTNESPAQALERLERTAAALEESARTTPANAAAALLANARVMRSSAAQLRTQMGGAGAGWGRLAVLGALGIGGLMVALFVLRSRATVKANPRKKRRKR